MNAPEQRLPPARLGIVAVAALAYLLGDVLHELGHAAATLLPLGVRAISISTIGLTTSSSSPIVAAAGPLANLVLALAIVSPFVSALPPAWRYFGWLFGSVNLFNATAYLIYSAVLGSGDFAVVFPALARPSLWRLGAGLGGLVLYAAAVVVSRAALQRMVASQVLDPTEVRRHCAISYWSGGLLVTAGSAFNPVSPWFILTSGAAVGFGAMAGLLLLPPLFGPARPGAAPGSPSIGWAWVVAGAIAAIAFVALLGPGVSLS